MPVEECLSIGRSLSRALAVLHRHELVHRDIKPANIIFVGGVPKIADIGLVASHGQDSFVGTEGYVPPEGHGSVQADLFSFGKVLYEMAMGKDRLDFPALHTDLTDLPAGERARLLRLNEVLLRACAHKPEDRYACADDLHADLEALAGGRALGAAHRRKRWPALAGAATLALAGGGGWFWWQQHEAPGSVSITAAPIGAANDTEAMILLQGVMHHSPAKFDGLPAGRYPVRILRAGFDPRDIEVDVRSGESTTIPPVALQRSHGSLELASNPAGAKFQLLQNKAVIREGVTPALLDDLLTGEYEIVHTHQGREKREAIEIRRNETARSEAAFPSGKLHIESDPAGARVAVDGVAAGSAPLDLSLAEGEHDLVAEYPHWPAQRQHLKIDPAQPSAAAFTFARGIVKITSAPGGATVLRDGQELGKTPCVLENQEPGPIECEFRLRGFKTQRITGEIKPGEQTFLGARFVQRNGPETGLPWENSLGMKFAPVDKLLVGVWPVRVRDYESFCVETSRQRLPVDFPQNPLHPVVRVNWDDATAFCEWLTQREVLAGLLETGQHYRLPTDSEWSRAAGLPPESGNTPEERDGKIHDYLWGRQWPPPDQSGNFADAPSKRGGAGIPGYHDGFKQTSPVGSFPPNALGLFDMAGNVWQWVQDAYKGGNRAKDWGVLRGGSWATSTQAELRAGYRNVIDRSERDVIFGFRVVLVPDAER
jgi:formylglycine-generating enzyme required for sulfatase activity